MQVHTVTGDISPKELGVTLMHEHIFTEFKEEYHQASVTFVEWALRSTMSYGVKILVDVGPFITRKMDWYKEIASRLPELNIICCTGYYLEESSVQGRYPKEVLEKDADQIAEGMIKEITTGIQGTDIKAGIIKVAANKSELTPFEKRNFIAASKAQVATGVPICTHACAGAASQMEVLDKAGASLERVYFSHIECESGWEGRTLEEEAHYLANISRRGGSLLFNNFGFEHSKLGTPWRDMIYLFKYLCDKGFSDRVLISVDANFRITKDGQIELEAQQEHFKNVRRVYSFLFTDAIPSLLKAGFTEDDIEQFIVRNPVRIFGE